MNDLDIVAVGPAQLLQRLQERLKASLSFGIVCGQALEHANASHALRLLRTNPHRHSRCAPEKRDEVAAGHSMTSSARASSADGRVRPSVFAVFRLIRS